MPAPLRKIIRTRKSRFPHHQSWNKLTPEQSAKGHAFILNALKHGKKPKDIAQSFYYMGINPDHAYRRALEHKRAVAYLPAYKAIHRTSTKTSSSVREQKRIKNK